MLYTKQKHTDFNSNWNAYQDMHPYSRTSKVFSFGVFRRCCRLKLHFRRVFSTSQCYVFGVRSLSCSLSALRSLTLPSTKTNSFTFFSTAMVVIVVAVDLVYLHCVSNSSYITFIAFLAICS